jgi:hypothetical protein
MSYFSQSRNVLFKLRNGVIHGLLSSVPIEQGGEKVVGNSHSIIKRLEIVLPKVSIFFSRDDLLLALGVGYRLSCLS